MVKLHPSLPAPVIHSSHLPTSQSKSHVLAGVQDAYWSDDEAVSTFSIPLLLPRRQVAYLHAQEDADCPLCMEEMDVSDLNFKPCPCGYQVSTFFLHFLNFL